MGESYSGKFPSPSPRYLRFFPRSANPRPFPLYRFFFFLSVGLSPCLHLCMTRSTCLAHLRFFSRASSRETPIPLRSCLRFAALAFFTLRVPRFPPYRCIITCPEFCSFPPVFAQTKTGDPRPKERCYFEPPSTIILWSLPSSR